MSNLFWKFIWFKRKLYTKFFLKPRFNSIGKNSVILKPLQLDYPKSAYVGENEFVNSGIWICGCGDSSISLKINGGGYIGHFCHIVAKHHVHIEKKVTIADKVFITDCTHEFRNPNLAISDQGIRNLGEVNIGDGSWIGENACIIGCSIGKNCIIGSNAVVTKDIPDYSIAVGIPAKVIKKYDFDKKEWTCV